MNTTPYWTDTAKLPKFARLRQNLEVDVIVIGGGITGVTAAYLLGKAGASVALLERSRFATAETGHTTAHLTYVTDSRLSQLVRDFGRDHAQAVWDSGRAAINQIADIVEEESIACELRWIPGYLHLPARHGNQDLLALQADARLAKELGFDGTLGDDTPVVAVPGIAFANQAKFNPAKYLRGMLQALRRQGCHTFENTEATSIEVEPVRVKANDRTVRGKYLVIATHVPLQGATGTVSAALFQTKIAPYSTYAVGAKIETGAAPEASFWDTADPYFYLRIDRHKGYDYAILGGADHKTGQTRDPQKHYERVEKRLRQLFPQARVDHRWSGQVIESNDGLPYMGETAPQQFVATAFAGNGLTLGTLAAMMARDVFCGRKNPWSALYDVHRKKVLGGTWNYLKENKDYPYDILSRCSPSQAQIRCAALPGARGKFVQIEGEKLAAYRDAKGKLTVKSAICTHMGCVVRWNPAEKTWDCPCHGSRFGATGEVMGGPAETPLADAGKAK